MTIIVALSFLELFSHHQIHHEPAYSQFEFRIHYEGGEDKVAFGMWHKAVSIVLCINV
jgi:hypothetical protein